MTDLQLDTLEARGLISVASFEPELEYLFRHALLQDTAYGSLLKQERRALHQVVGHTIETLYPERMGELAAVLARHFEQAGDSDKAIGYLVAAAKFAVDRNAIVEGHDLYGRAAALLPPEGDAEGPIIRRRRVEIELGRARAGFTFIPESEALAMLERVMPAAQRLDDPRLEAEVLLTAAMLRQFRGEDPAMSPELRQSLDRVSEIARQIDDPVIAALPESIMGLFKVFNGQLREGVALLAKTAPQLEQKHDFVGSSFALVALAMGYARLGEFDLAEAAASRAREIAERGDLIARLDSTIGAANVRSIRGDLDEAVPLAMECTNLAEETGAVACVVASNFTLGDVYMRQGKHEQAKLVLQRGHEVANAINERQFRPSIAAYMRSNAASLGELAETASFEEALELTRARGDRWSEANVLWKRAETELKRPAAERNADQMLGDYEAAATAFGRMEARPYEARVLRAWGDALRELDTRNEADLKLRAALTLFEEMGIKREAEEVRATLAS